MFFNQFIQVLWILMSSMSGFENTDDNTISRRYSALAHSFISLLSPDNGESVNTTNTSPAQPSTRSVEPGQGNQDPTRLSTHIMSTPGTRPPTSAPWSLALSLTKVSISWWRLIDFNKTVNVLNTKKAESVDGYSGRLHPESCGHFVCRRHYDDGTKLIVKTTNWKLVYDGVFPCLIIVTSGGSVPCVGWITLFVMFVVEARGPSWVQVIR